MQFEFPWALGPADGRYVVRAAAGQAPSHVLVLATLGAPERRWRSRGRGARPIAPEPPPAPVTTARATVIDAVPVTLREAERWLAAAGPEEAERALAQLARAVDAHRLASADPSVREPALAQALAVRAGHGAGEQVADGRWDAARELAPARPPRRRRSAGLRPQERLAALLGGRDRALACEELTLRARGDLDRGRLREAALQLRAALDAALAELTAEAPHGAADPAQRPAGPSTGDLAQRIGDPAQRTTDAARRTIDAPQGAGGGELQRRVAELRERRTDVAALAEDALRGELPADAEARLAEPLARLEAALRARIAATI